MALTVQAPKRNRIAALDMARGVALIAMAVYHFTWDLEFFGFAAAGLTGELPCRLFARSIASSFLFLAGVSLFAAQSGGFDRSRYLARLIRIGGAALLISAATWFAMPGSFIFFGILHEIFAASLIGLLLLRLPALLLLALAATIIALPYGFSHEAFDGRWLAWTGFAAHPPRSNDLVTLFPWTGAFLAGLGAAKLAPGFLAALRKPAPAWAGPLAFAGRHSLAFYLIHQPVLISLVWLAAQIVPPPGAAPEARFTAACSRTCAQTREAAFCAAYCTCVLDRLAVSGMLEPVLAGSSEAPVGQSLDDAVLACTEKAEGAENQ